MNTPINGIRRESVLGHQLNADEVSNQQWCVQYLSRTETGGFRKWENDGAFFDFYQDAEEAMQALIDDEGDTLKGVRIVCRQKLQITHIVDERGCEDA